MCGMNIPRILLISITCLAFLVGIVLHPARGIDERAILGAIAPNLTFSAKQGAPPLYRATDAVAFNSHDIVPGINGYAGPIKLMLLLAPDGTIRGVKIIEHSETKTYVHYLETPQFLNQFIGKHVQDAFEVDRDIDGVTRATVSVAAIARTVRESSRIVAAAEYGIRATTTERLTGGSIGVALYAALFIIAFGLYLQTRRTKRWLRVRDAALLAALLTIGVFLSSPFSILHPLNLLLSRFSSAPLWYLLLISIVASIIFAGRFYCGWLCPFGALSEMIGRLPSRKWFIPRGLDDAWRRFKYLLLGLIVAAVLITRRTEYGAVEVYLTLFSLHGGALAWSLVALMLLANLFVPRFWCRYFCPVGAFTALLSRRDAAYPGSDDCPIGNRSPADPHECIRCNRCHRTTGNGAFLD